MMKKLGKLEKIMDSVQIAFCAPLSIKGLNYVTCGLYDYNFKDIFLGSALAFLGTFLTIGPFHIQEMYNSIKKEESFINYDREN